MKLWRIYLHFSHSDDILHARIQTMGVAEHIFDVDIHGKSVTWHLFDVGGARGQRHSWVPYFDDANAIIFVAPVSAFDQVFITSLLTFWCPLSFSPWLGFYFSCLYDNACDSPLSHLLLHIIFSTWRKTQGQTGLTTHSSYSRKSVLTPS